MHRFICVQGYICNIAVRVLVAIGEYVDGVTGNRFFPLPNGTLNEPRVPPTGTVVAYYLSLLLTNTRS